MVLKLENGERTTKWKLWNLLSEGVSYENTCPSRLNNLKSLWVLMMKN